MLIEPERLASSANIDRNLSAQVAVQRPVGHLFSAIGARHGPRF